jgi:hypothetical protein
MQIALLDLGYRRKAGDTTCRLEMSDDVHFEETR